MLHDRGHRVVVCVCACPQIYIQICVCIYMYIMYLFNHTYEFDFVSIYLSIHLSMYVCVCTLQVTWLFNSGSIGRNLRIRQGYLRAVRAFVPEGICKASHIRPYRMYIQLYTCVHIYIYMHTSVYIYIYIIAVHSQQIPKMPPAIS